MPLIQRDPGRDLPENVYSERIAELLAQLAPWERIFVEVYLQRFDLHDAAVEASTRLGLNEEDSLVTGMMDRARSIVLDPIVSEVLALRLAEHKLTADKVLQLLSQQATASLGDFFRIAPDGTPILDLLKAQERGRLHLVKSISFYANGSVRDMFLHDSQRALELLMRHYGLMERRVTVSIENRPSPEDEMNRLERVQALLETARRRVTSGAVIEGDFVDRSSDER